MSAVDVDVRIETSDPRLPLPLVDLDAGRALLWSAKSGCTALTLAFLMAADPTLAVDFSKPVKPSDVTRLRNAYAARTKATPASVELWLRQRSLFKIKAVRNPFTRVVSAFVMLMRDFLRNGRDLTGLVAAAASNRDVGDPRFLSFVDFLGFLETLQLECANIHVRPQLSAFERDADNAVDFRISIESIEADLARLRLEQGLDLTLPRSPTFRHHHAPSDSTQCVAATPFCELHSIPSHRYFYDLEAMQLVQACYRDDLSAYGYHYPWQLPEG